MKKCGFIVDIFKEKIYKGCVYFNQNITEIKKDDNVKDSFYILPGFIDAHVHIESSMLIPSRFSRLALKNGTVATISDPHEIANVLGIDGINFMIEDSKKTPLKIYFGVPSCVPATPFETSGAILDSKTVEKLLARDDLYYLSEVMNYPGVINNDTEIIAKIKAAKRLNKRVDGHAPGLRGEDLQKYINAGVETDHEAYTYEEGKEKIEKGMKILIREGSAAKNFEALYKLIDEYPNEVMFCTDDSHPDDLYNGHINNLVKRALNKGLNLFNVLKAASINAINFYGIDVGTLQKNTKADFIVVDNLKDFNILETYINGQKVYSNNSFFIEVYEPKAINKFNAKKICKSDLIVKPKSDKIKIIKAFDGELYTDLIIDTPKIYENNVISDIERDILKIVVLNRYKPANPSISFINGFGLKKGAIAMSIAHDSHNIISVGASDSDIINAINKLIEMKGGLVVYHEGKFDTIKLPYAGLMTDAEPESIAFSYKRLNNLVKELGSELNSPFMTLSFMALLVIPKIKIGDKGLFDVTKFDFTDVFA